MATTIRLTRMGRRNRPFYRIVVTDSRTRRDGKYIEQIGHYDPMKKDKANRVHFDEEKALEWLRKGAQVSDTVRNFFSKTGLMMKWHFEKSGMSEEKQRQEMQKWELSQKEKNREAQPAESADTDTADAAPSAEETPETVDEPEKDTAAEDKQAADDDTDQKE